MALNGSNINFGSRSRRADRVRSPRMALAGGAGASSTAAARNGAAASDFHHMRNAEDHRGRKRHRSHTRHALTATHLGNSATCRGRPPRRATSPMLPLSRPASSSLSASPARRNLLQVVLLEHQRRSQSPSRSRSPGGGAVGDTARRRQRTRSRSRSHDRTTPHCRLAEGLSGLRIQIFPDEGAGMGDGSK